MLVLPHLFLNLFLKQESSKYFKYIKLTLTGINMYSTLLDKVAITTGPSIHESNNQRSYNRHNTHY